MSPSGAGYLGKEMVKRHRHGLHNSSSPIIPGPSPLRAFIIATFCLLWLGNAFSKTKSAQVAITKYQGEGGLNNRHLCITVLEIGKSKIKVPTHLAVGMGPLPG